MTTIAWAIGALLVGIGGGFVVANRSHHKKLGDASQQAEALLREAQDQADQTLKTREAAWTAQQQAFEEKAHETKRALRKNRQILEQRQEKLGRRAKKLNEKEHLLQQGTEALSALRHDAETQQRTVADLRKELRKHQQEIEQTQETLANEQIQLTQSREVVAAQQARLDELVEQSVRKLEQVAGLSRHEAIERLKEQLLEAAKLEASGHIKSVRDEAKLTAGREARKIVLNTIQRTASSHTVENTISVINIDSDDMKGRIIGREGRNIRAFEAATGIEVIVDDTPEAVILSGFDAVRREVARVALQRLIQDGRIHPTRIEEVVEKVKTEVEEEIVETGERTVIDLGLQSVHPELIRLVGRMRYRTSYGQNLLAHSIEVAKLCSVMAAELGLDAQKARRAGLFHDIGKVVEGDLEKPHAIVGMDLCQKYKEHKDVCNAVGSHHDEIEMTTPLAPIVQSCDAISGARPGARRETLENYIKRLRQLESRASSFKGVERVYAIQAGRELRVIVNHDLISDAAADQLAADIAQKIEAEMQYPGQVKVTVIREVRATSYAK